MVMFTTTVSEILLLLLLMGCLPGQAQGSAGKGIGFAPPHRTAARAASTKANGLQIFDECSYHYSFRSVRDQREGTASQPRPSYRHRVVLYASNNNNNNNKKKKDPESQVKTPNYKPADDGRSVGFVLLGVSLLASAWLFTIPPSFRRAYLCPSDYFANSNNNGIAQEQTTDCVPWKVWWSDVVAYYRSGGGIQWDISIDPQTVRDNREFLDAVIASYSNRIETQSN
jgi:hypothetical protein